MKHTCDHKDSPCKSPCGDIGGLQWQAVTWEHMGALGQKHSILICKYEYAGSPDLRI